MPIRTVFISLPWSVQVVVRNTARHNVTTTALTDGLMQVATTLR